MKFNLTETIKDYEGKTVKEKDKEITWKDVLFMALNNQAQGETMTPEEKQKCFELTQRSFQSDEVEFDVDETKFVLDRIKKIYAAPLIVGRAIEFFNKEQEVDTKKK